MAKKFEIRNSTAEFLIFVIKGKENGVQVMYKDETIWCTQKAMSSLSDVGVPAINKHLNNIYEDGELPRESTISKMEIVQTEGEREVKRQMEFYNLDTIISVGYRVNSVRATQFRQRHTLSPNLRSIDSSKINCTGRILTDLKTTIFYRSILILIKNNSYGK